MHTENTDNRRERVALAMSEERKALRCYWLASELASHSEALQAALDLGYADGLADFDEKVREVEEATA